MYNCVHNYTSTNHTYIHRKYFKMWDGTSYTPSKYKCVPSPSRHLSAYLRSLLYHKLRGRPPTVSVTTRIPTSHALVQIEHNSSSQVWDMRVGLGHVLEDQLQAVCPPVSVLTLAYNHLVAQALKFYEQMILK